MGGDGGAILARETKEPPRSPLIPRKLTNPWLSKIVHIILKESLRNHTVNQSNIRNSYNKPEKTPKAIAIGPGEPASFARTPEDTP